MKKCTWCGKEYPNEAKVCALDRNPLCWLNGTPVREPEPEPAPKPAKSVVVRHRTAERDMMIGGLWCIGGLFVTAITYAAATARGGIYVVAWGAIFFGGLRFLHGLFRARKNSGQIVSQISTSYDSNDPQSLLVIAARLESVDRAKAVAKYEEVIAQFPGTSESAEAERSIQTLTSYKT